MDKLTAERRSENMKKIRSKGTSPEVIVRSLVHGMGYRYRLHSNQLPGKPDICLARLNKVIDVRGCFWHQHGKCVDSHIPKSRQDYWIPKLQRNQDRDKENMRRLKSLGWKVLVVWECDVVRNPKRLAVRLRRFLEG